MYSMVTWEFEWPNDLVEDFTTADKLAHQAVVTDCVKQCSTV